MVLVHANTCEDRYWSYWQTISYDTDEEFSRIQKYIAGKWNERSPLVSVKFSSHSEVLLFLVLLHILTYKSLLTSLSNSINSHLFCVYLQYLPLYFFQTSLLKSVQCCTIVSKKSVTLLNFGFFRKLFFAFSNSKLSPF